MKTSKRILSVAALAATLSLAINASAQSVGYRPTGDDGITASPKLRQTLNERKTATSSTIASVPAGYRATVNGVTASPKLQQTLAAHKAPASAPDSAVASAGYRPTGDDGITASPKLRDQLNSRSSSFTVAPLK